MKKDEKMARKQLIGKKAVKDTFNYFAVKDLTYDEGVKVRDFWLFCNTKVKCVPCNNKFDSRKDKNSYGLVLKCDRCLHIETMDDPITQKMVKWFDDLLEEKVGVSFSDGWPPLLKLPDGMGLDDGSSKKKIKGTFNL